jgi:hypothetical protein
MKGVFCRLRVREGFSMTIKKNKLGQRRPVVKRYVKGQWIEGHFQDFKGNFMFRVKNLYLNPSHFDKLDLRKEDPDMEMDDFTKIMQALGRLGGENFRPVRLDLFSLSSHVICD